MFVEGYSTKQWGCAPRSLPTSIIKRIPVRLTHDDTYFSDTMQGIPIGGYTLMVERILGGIKVALDADFNENPDGWHQRRRSGGLHGRHRRFLSVQPLGPLGYRSLGSRASWWMRTTRRACSVINHCDITTPWTRTIEHRHFMGREPDPTGQTLVTIEYPSDEGEPFYPINTGGQPGPAAQLQEARGTSISRQSCSAAGWANIRYLDMHQVIASAAGQVNRAGGATEMTKPLLMQGLPNSGSTWFASVAGQHIPGCRYYDKEFFNPVCNMKHEVHLASAVRLRAGRVLREHRARATRA